MSSRFLRTGWVFTLAIAVSHGEEEPRTFDNFIEPFLSNYCVDCHDASEKKGGVDLEQLTGITVENAEVWKSVWEQVSLKEMPPRKKKNQPESLDRLAVANWITDELEKTMAEVGGFHRHQHPRKANHLPHELLFGDLPEGLRPTSTPARIWRIHPQEHLVRLNALINIDQEYDPRRPGLRTMGDHIPWNNQGEEKVYYGLDRITGWVGGTAAYAAAVTGFPAVFSMTGDHGLRDYPILYSVNGSEATQIARHAEDILRFMAWGPVAEPYQFGDQRKLPAKYNGVDIRGTTQSLFYKEEVMRPLTPVYDLMKDESFSQEKLQAAVMFLFESLTQRPAGAEEVARYVLLANESIKALGEKEGAILGLTPIFLDPEALFRSELAKGGVADEHGRVMLEGWELALAINHAFSYLGPDHLLKEAVSEGRLTSREDVSREVKRILKDESIRKPRVLQFFREYFDYDRAGRICKDSASLKAAGGDERRYYETMLAMTAHVDRLIELIVQEDQNVLRELLTTDRVVCDPAREKLFYSHFENLKKPARVANKKDQKKGSKPVESGETVFPKGVPIWVRLSEFIKNDKAERLLTTLPRDQRMGILTHPAWLVSQSDAMDNHAIHRGIWIRERLLGDAVPDVPITVDAQLPDEPQETLRHRMRVTRKEECWRCHQKMDPLGLPFEMFNHIGLYRTTEKGKPVDASGEILYSGDSNLDGPVKDALEMISKLAKSERVEQVFVRHAFRYWIGRNETIEDAPVLQAAWRAYRDNSGSMKALIESLVTSDAFIYRTVAR
jgi:hypothetical protein